MSISPTDVTSLLVAWSQGDQAACDQLFAIVYEELRRLARNYLRRERPHHTFESKDLVHEAYLRLIDQKYVTWKNRAHFFGIAAQMMRRILVNHAIARRTEKRGGMTVKLPLDAAINRAREQDLDLVALDDALGDLEALDPRQCRVVELRFFSGLSIEETAEMLGISPATVSREWSIAKMWLHRELSKEG